ncbi:two-component response regulator ARR11-like [Lycium barbarum]|uniref:two-component response regulator ARR11-like n=1 Tax=Lycium barbarum TaxID=112863 RepID=UPI00293EE21D|nr:two-component response regulator ARR11-like [Lycium barbarum]
MVDLASTAMLMFSKGKENIDVMIINVNSFDLLSFKLLDQAVALYISSVVVCDEPGPFLAEKALNAGAYLYLKKPLLEEIVKYLWQFVLREKNQKKKVREGLEENGDQVNVIGDPDDIGNKDIIGNDEQDGEKNVPNTEEHSNNIHKAENNIVSNGKYKLRRKRGCYPTDILKAMNVPGLTNRQVASHLQSFRRAKIYSPPPSGQGSSSGSQQRSSFRNFGTMLRLQTNVANLKQQQRNIVQIQSGQKGDSSTQQQLYRTQLQVQPIYLNIDSPFNNPFLLVRNNVDGGIQQQHGSLFGMLGSQGL